MHRLPDYPQLLALAPTTLRNFRLRRYHGDDQAVDVDAFADDDARVIRRLYDFLQGLFVILKDEGEARANAFRWHVQGEEIETLFGQVGRLGIATLATDETPLFGQVLHDVRGGGLTCILGQIEMWKLGAPGHGLFDTLYYLVRDHLKIMRNALLGLDDPRRSADLEIKIHGSDLILKRWDGLRVKAGDDREIQVEVECPSTLAIAECCVEFGALDRILYNLLNNARRHTSSGRVRLVLFPVPDEAGAIARFVLLNVLGEQDRARLAKTNFQTLFRSGVSTTGSGFGLAVVAGFVANAFGIAQPADAVKKGYLGATLLDDQFAIWFHWPIVPESVPA